MKRNLGKILILSALIVVLCLALASCGLLPWGKEDAHVHEWGEGTVTTEATCEQEGVRTFTCSCNQTKTEPIAKKEHSYTMVETKPTCTTAGSKLYTCSCGNSYSDPIAATGHNYKTTEYAPTCAAYGYTHSVCQNAGCDSEYKKLTTILDHNYALDTTLSSAATCSADGSNVYVCQNAGCQYSYSETVKATAHHYVLDADSVQEVSCLVHGQATYVCDGCQDSYTVVTQAAKGKHNLTGVTWTASEPVHLDGCNYKIVETAECVDCHEVVTREKTIQQHNHAVEVVDPTCTTPGLLVYTCACGDTYEKEYAINPNAHVWGDPDGEGVSTCYECSATKKELVVENGAVSKNDVTADTELKLDNNATMQMDQTLIDKLPANATLGADVVDKDALDIDEDVKDRIGDSPIYNFTLTDGTNNIDFDGGKMTVKVPYTLGAGEDPNNIVVWYLADNGEVEAIPATYVNGEAVFEVTHFSRYTVVRMTPEELCAKLGCEEYTIKYPATCTADGYTLVVCKRCHKTETVNAVEAYGHDYTKTTVSATCTTGGYDSYACTRCGDSYKANYVDAKGHSYTDTVVAATCATKGYTLHTCSACQGTYKDAYTDAIGHSFNEGTCVKCGAIDNGYVAAEDNFYFNLIESLLGIDNLYVKLSDVKITISSYEVIGGTETLDGSAVLTLDLVHLMLTVDENGNPIAKGEGKMVGTADTANFFGQFNGISGNVVVVLKDGALYLFVEAEADGEKHQGEIFIDITKSEAMDSFEQMAQIVSTLEMLYSEGLDDIIAGIKELRGNPINGVIAAIMEYVYVKEETATGYVFTLNYDRLPEIYDVVMNKNVAEIFDVIFGEGALFELTNWVKTTWTKDFGTVEAELSDLCTSIGVDLKDVYAYINTVVGMMSGSPEDQNDPEYKAFDVEELIAELRDTLVCDYVNGMAGEGNEITAEQFAEQIDSIVEQIGSLTVMDLYEMIFASSQPDSPSEGDNGNNGNNSYPSDDEYYGPTENGDAPKYSDVAEEPDPIREQIVAIAEMLKGISITFTTDKDGAFISFNINVDIEDLPIGSANSETVTPDKNESYIPGADEAPYAARESVTTVVKVSASGAFVVNTTGTVAKDFADVIANITNKVNKVTFNEGDEIVDINPSDDDYYRTEYYVVSHEGKLYFVPMLKTYDIRFDYYSEYEDVVLDGVACRKYVCKIYNHDVACIDDIYQYFLESNCNGYIDYSFDTNSGYYSVTYDVYMSESGELIKVELNKERTFVKENYRSYGSVPSLTYSVSEGKFYLYEDMHNLVLTDNKKPVCCDQGVKTYTCTACGYTEKEYYDGPETIETLVTLKTPGTTCEAGVHVEQKCKVCNKVYDSYDTNYHAMSSRIIPVDSACGNTYVSLKICACGKFSEHYTWNGYGFIEGNCIIGLLEEEYEDVVDKENGELKYPDGRFGVYRATYRCAVEGCNVEYTFDRYTIHYADECKARTFYTYNVNGTEYTLVATEDFHTSEGYEELPNVQVGPYSVPHGRTTCSICHEVVEDYLYLEDKYGRVLVNYNNLTGSGTMRIFNSDCTYQDYKLDENLNYYLQGGNGDGYYGDDYLGYYNKQHADVWYDGYHHIEGTCTQAGRDERYCPACHLIENEVSHYPEGHSFEYDYDRELYVCYRCGVESTKGVDANFIMEDFAHLNDFSNDIFDLLKYHQIAVGFYNKNAHRGVDVYVIVNDNWLEVDYERHYVNEGYDDKYGEYNTLCGKVVLDNESLMQAIQERGITEITSIAVNFSYYDPASDTYLNEILTIYEATELYQ